MSFAASWQREPRCQLMRIVEKNQTTVMMGSDFHKLSSEIFAAAYGKPFLI